MRPPAKTGTPADRKPAMRGLCQYQNGRLTMYAVVTAILIATAPGTAPENKAAYFTAEGPELCYAAADKLNDRDDSTLYVCKVAE